jgi:gamma-glutamyltranspeptidase / glutathione hydrolase
MMLSNARLERSCAIWLSTAVLAVTVLAAPAQAKAPVALSAAAVAVADKYGADTAAQIFRAGGNAADAAVAIAFTLAVTYPEAGNIGGGGFMTLYMNGKPYFLDYRERAPLAATRDMYLGPDGKVVPGASLIGYRAVGVPGTVAGMWAVQHRFGKLPWRAVLAPAIHYARDGFEVDDLLARREQEAAAAFDGKTDFTEAFGSMHAGEVFKQPALADVLQRLAQQGADDFYRGQTAHRIVDAMRTGGGLITLRDLAQYRAVWREPVQADWHGMRVITAPPPSSGGVGLIQLLEMKADRADLFNGVPLNSPQYIHLVAELEKRVFADRAQYLGDPDVYQVPVAQLIAPLYLAERAADVNPNTPSPTRSIQPGLGTALPEMQCPTRTR